MLRGYKCVHVPMYMLNMFCPRLRLWIWTSFLGVSLAPSPSLFSNGSASLPRGRLLSICLACSPITADERRRKQPAPREGKCKA